MENMLLDYMYVLVIEINFIVINSQLKLENNIFVLD
jgi:hypothetical protein